MVKLSFFKIFSFSRISTMKAKQNLVFQEKTKLEAPQ